MERNLVDRQVELYFGMGAGKTASRLAERMADKGRITY